MLSMFGNNPKMQQAMSAMQGKTPEEQQKIAMNYFNNSGFSNMGMNNNPGMPQQNNPFNNGGYNNFGNNGR